MCIEPVSSVSPVSFETLATRDALVRKRAFRRSAASHPSQISRGRETDETQSRVSGVQVIQLHNMVGSFPGGRRAGDSEAQPICVGPIFTFGSRSRP